MPTGRFSAVHNNYFNSIDGAYTSMTAEEVRKGTFNVKAVIKAMAIANKLPPALNRSITYCNFNISSKVSGFQVPQVNLVFKYSKPLPKEEMTIYFNASSGIPQSKLVADNIWFIYCEAGNPIPSLGIMTPVEWAIVTGGSTMAVSTTSATSTPTMSAVTNSMRKISKKILTPEDILVEKAFDHEITDDIGNSEIPATATFEYLGTPREKQIPISSGARNIYRRDKQVALNALIKAQHKCEVDVTHPSFLRKNKDILYMEPHHLIPLAYQDEFEKSLDVEENIVSLCSNCHNRFHYGWGLEKILRTLYDERAEHLRRVGIEISFDDLLEMYT